MSRVLLFSAIALAVFAIAADAPPPEVEVETVDQRTLTGKLLNPTIRVRTTYGVHEIDVHLIQKITFGPVDAGPGHDIIDFTDKEHLRGEVVSESLRIEFSDRIESFDPHALRELKTTAKKAIGIWSLIFGLVTLAAMEIVLGIDNVIFLAIVAGKLPPEQQPKARRIGLFAALGTRILLLFSLSFLLGLTKPVFTIPDLPAFHDLEAREVSLRDIVLLAGGLFLIWKSVKEMHEKLEAAKAAHHPESGPKKVTSFASVLVQIAILDIVFSLDSVITAVGMVDELWVMIVAMIIAMLVMLVFAGSISNFVARHPTIKVLALSFLILIGVMLVAESLGQHMNKGYIYFAMAFGVGVEMLNLRLRKKPTPA